MANFSMDFLYVFLQDFLQDGDQVYYFPLYASVHKNAWKFLLKYSPPIQNQQFVKVKPGQPAIFYQSEQQPPKPG